MTAVRLSDYALIGNSRAAALVSNKGSIDWCCLPRFDSSSIFAALLDSKQGGSFSVAPSKPYKSDQKYLPDTNVLETCFRTEDGEIRLLDAFTAMSEEEKAAALFPDHEILRIVEGISGTVQMRLVFAPRTNYGKNAPHLANYGKLGIRFSWKENIYTLLSTLNPEEIKVTPDAHGLAEAGFLVKPGEHIIFSLSYSGQSPAVLPELKITGWKRFQQTISYWRNWVGKCHYQGLYKEQVKRSALVLKLLAYAPSGAIIAAPTTSLPEKLGGERNWDYRYCWLRDASFTTRVLVSLGFEDEAHAYMNWILHATQLTRPELQVVYSVFGNASLKEEKLDWLAGYKGSRPVRIGNGADGQFQLDVYGEVLDAVYTYAPLVEDFDRNTRKFVLGLGEIICKRWNQPDNGIWEVRTTCIHHTHSKVMAWVGLDRLIKLSEKYQWKEAPLEKYYQVASCIHNEIENLGYNSALKSYTRELGGNTLDASLLILSLVGYCSSLSPRMISTIRLIYERLSKNNLVYRYRGTNDGLEGDEGSFGICSFWLAENLAKSGQLQNAITVFETMLHHASPTGLLSEEIDPESGELLGNYPQGFTHIGLINAALSINEAHQKEEMMR
ncbi:glycoside hydrolase family 15 protein [Pontibacter sp. 172403-2]|uniref:glycoside hydrolase family 15 protein n=1 Tax=Pontibacter rufus TaxID=2791028 RepID=UPI0018AFCF13|nr:glycoside hydrolase family 15 protein [Pontibacter sp. 172403-2]MBF9253764.1 glycoside hydrolase family 15 protein [Pontibacter sp. 172403-2]